jgi:hypothetical protein
MMSAAFFVLWMLVAMLVSEAPLSQEFWGVFGRNSGFLTYFSLIVLLLSSALVQTEKFYANLIRSFVLTSFPLTLYALIQLVGMDPIAWSQMAPFATLGNINFSSAFFGLASIVQGVLVLHSRTSVQLKLLLVSFLLVNIFIILQTGSIQGVMIFIAGMGIVIFLKIRSILSLKFLKFPYLIGGLLIFILTFMAL